MTAAGPTARTWLASELASVAGRGRFAGGSPMFAITGLLQFVNNTTAVLVALSALPLALGRFVLLFVRVDGVCWSCRLCRLCRSCPSVPVRARPCAPPCPPNNGSRLDGPATRLASCR